MKQVIILRGPSGSGKSTFAKDNFPTGYLCGADQFFMINGQYRFDPTKLGEAHSWCYNRFLHAMWDNRNTIVVDNTNTKRWEVQNYVLAAKMRDYVCEIFTFRAYSVADIRLCVESNTHGVPPHVISMMAVDFEPWEPETYIPIFDGKRRRMS